MTNINNTASSMYALTLSQAENLIAATGHQRTVLVQGHMGTGKSSLLSSLAKSKPGHTPCYFDCTTKDLGDITLPRIAEAGADAAYVSYATNEELGAHIETPIILMIDEYGKANPAVKNALLRLMLERKIGSYTLHPDSIVFATTNLGAEGVGDLLPPHARNRITVVTSRKPSNVEWIEWAINHDVDHTLLGWCKDNPQLFHGFEDYRDPEENPYIYHPRSQRAAFVTPRSLHAASDILKTREFLDDHTVTAALCGTIGDRAAMDLMAFVSLADKLPSLQSIKDDPMGAAVPDNAAAICMVVYRSLAAIERDWLDAWMTYLGRLDREAQGLFVNGVRSPKYSKQAMVMTHATFTQWAIQHNWLFAADKK